MIDDDIDDWWWWLITMTMMMCVGNWYVLYRCCSLWQRESFHQSSLWTKPRPSEGLRRPSGPAVSSHVLLCDAWHQGLRWTWVSWSLSQYRYLHLATSKGAFENNSERSDTNVCARLFCQIVLTVDIGICLLRRTVPNCCQNVRTTRSLDDSNPANYRPISNLNNISKLLERLFFIPVSRSRMWLL